MAEESRNIVPLEMNIMIEALEAESEGSANRFRIIASFTAMRIRGGM
jgi:hypothetical protein